MKPLKPSDHAADHSPLRATDMTVVLVVSGYHADISGTLAAGARRAFEDAGGRSERLEQIHAPGAFELPVISLAAAQRADVDAVVAIGCVLTGETSHDRYISDAVAHGLMRVGLETGKPVCFGVLTCATIEQARARAGGPKGNKGEEAMGAALRAVAAIRALSGSSVGGSPRGAGSLR
jgi:6,7-dimethyl-8-ribityllumazine synthase